MEIELEQQQIWYQVAVQKFASMYQIQTSWHTQIVSGHNTLKVCLLDEHNDYSDNDPKISLTTTTNIAKNCTKIIIYLQGTDCFDAIQIQIGTQTTDTDTDRDTDIDTDNTDTTNSTTTTNSNNNERTIQINMNSYTFYVGAGSIELGFGSR